MEPDGHVYRRSAAPISPEYECEYEEEE